MISDYVCAVCRRYSSMSAECRTRSATSNFNTEENINLLAHHVNPVYLCPYCIKHKDSKKLAMAIRASFS